MPRAFEKQNVVDYARGKMRELAEQGDRAGVDRVFNWALGRATGSNARKDNLRAAHKRALELIDADTKPMQATKRDKRLEPTAARRTNATVSVKAHTRSFPRKRKAPTTFSRRR